ncbi:hypothetical protein ACF0H5_020059 [Mactra antiquata]
MWQYFFAHATYHGVRWFPQGNRLKMSLFMITLAALMPIPQLRVVTLERSSRWCDQPLLPLAIASIILTFFTLGFSILFCVLIPVPRAVKIAFHVIGIGALIVGFWQIIATLMGFEVCSVSTPELYFLSQISSILSFGSIVFLTAVFPFWIINEVKKNLVLDPYSRDGICYEPVKCCTCIWHI